MPVPLIIWAVGAAGAAYIAWQYRAEIAEFFDSEDGRRLIKGGIDAAKGHMEPYKQILDECYSKDSSKRRIFFSEAKKRMDSDDWNNLLAYSKFIVSGNLKYAAVVADLFYIDENED